MHLGFCGGGESQVLSLDILLTNYEVLSFIKFHNYVFY